MRMRAHTCILFLENVICIEEYSIRVVLLILYTKAFYNKIRYRYSIIVFLSFGAEIGWYNSPSPKTFSSKSYGHYG